jgi:hypothetical protein
VKKLEKQAIGIVAQLFDLAEVPVDKRQEINDVAYDYVTEQLNLHIVSQQRELLAFKDWFNKLPEDSDDRLYLTDETINRFKANCG